MKRGHFLTIRLLFLEARDYLGVPEGVSPSVSERVSAGVVFAESRQVNPAPKHDRVGTPTV